MQKAPAGLPVGLAPTELRAVRRSLSDVTDAQLVQVVALIDRMTERGDADTFIAPFRARLGQLGPRRPLRFGRLLFLPLDPVIVPAPRFRPGTPCVPRSALAPFSLLVHAALGARANEIEAAVAGRATEDTETIGRAGAVLWSEAAVILGNAPQPPGWAAAGLPGGLYKPLALGIAAVLEQAATMHALATDVAAGLPLDVAAIDAILTKAAPHGAEAWSLVLAVLLGRLPDADAILLHANAWMVRQGAPDLRTAIDQVAETQLARLESDEDGGAQVQRVDLADAGAYVHRLAGMLDGLAGATPPLALRLRVDAIRTRVDANCRQRFANGMAGEFMAPLRQLREASGPVALQGLEAAARQLRVLETEARRLGGAPTYDTLLREAAMAVRNMASDDGLPLGEKVRLIEILAGPEEALALLT